ncbi:hypothetical protein [Scytonema sp. NUACC26]|uniref:hypothetical protein n=1 Tax=Scytonema sp. NUACC26 TaxID=3140176 RepID=UPI0034DC64D2
MKELKTTSNLSLQDRKWQFPIDVDKYNCHLDINNDEKKEIQAILKTTYRRSHKTDKALERLLNPLYDVFKFIQTQKRFIFPIVKVILREIDNK